MREFRLKKEKNFNDAWNAEDMGVLGFSCEERPNHSIQETTQLPIGEWWNKAQDPMHLYLKLFVLTNAGVNHVLKASRDEMVSIWHQT